MTAPTIEGLPVRIPSRALPPRLVHVTCLMCLSDVTFCGIDAADLPPLGPETATPTCAVCIELRDTHDWLRCLEDHS